MSLSIWHDIEKTIISYFGNNWVSTEIQYPNTVKDMASYGVWVSINVIPLAANRLTITGNNDTGIMYIGDVVMNIFRDLNKGTGVLKQHVDNIINLFRYKTLTIEGEKIIQFKIPQHYVLGMCMEGTLWQESISISFECLV